MIPYADFYYFILLLLLLLPTIIGGLKGERMKGYNSVLTLVILGIIFGNKPIQLFSLIGYVVWQLLIVKLYLSYRQKKNEGTIFYGAVIIAILPLAAVKIVPVLQPNTVIGFLGISYLTFKAVQVIIDIRDGSLKQLQLSEYLYFLLYFPTITSGPIDRFKRFKKDYDQQLTGVQYQQYLYDGINKLFLGFIYKFILGYLINFYILQSAFVAEDTFLSKLAYMYGYSFYLFFDFAGYSAFAIGISYFMGIKTPENFNKPFLSKNIKDFWNRWHMSLSFWFRDYVYMRMVFFLTKKKVIKDRYLISYIGFLTLFLLMGVWHGLTWYYIIYGLYHACMIIGYDYFERKNKVHKFWPKNKFTLVVSTFITFNVVCFGFYIFSGQLF
ncbi:MAG: D-alanyl-lipoteichoic acid biosynthesis protein DltB [Bacillaceae bacterium]